MNKLRKPTRRTCTEPAELEACLLAMHGRLAEMEFLFDAITTRNLVTQEILDADTPIFHGLNRAPRGVLVASPSVPTAISLGSDSPKPGTYINLKAGEPVTATLIFF